MFIRDSVLREQLEKIHRHYAFQIQQLTERLEEASLTNKELLKECASQKRRADKAVELARQLHEVEVGHGQDLR